MLNKTETALDFLLTRRSTPAKTLTLPVPDRAALMPILQAAARSPDHGKLVPWRFIVLERAALKRLAAALVDHGTATGVDPEKVEKLHTQFASAHLAVAVISCPQVSEKIPEYEQTLSVGAVCTGLLNAALASGWGANWLSGWASHDPVFVSDHMGVKAPERVAGLIHIGTRSSEPPERPRPDLDTLVTWMDT